jgi:hypothetical protein
VGSLLKRGKQVGITRGSDLLGERIGGNFLRVDLVQLNEPRLNKPRKFQSIESGSSKLESQLNQSKLKVYSDALLIQDQQQQVNFKIVTNQR